MEPKDSAEIAKAIVDALDKAMKTMGRNQGGRAGGQTSRNEQNDAGKQSKQNSKIILATSTSLEKLEGAANDSASALGGFAKKASKFNTGLGNLGGSLGKAAAELSDVRSSIKKIKFDSLADDISKAIVDAVGSGKHVGTSPVIDEALVKRTNSSLDLFRESVRKTSIALTGFVTGLGVAPKPPATPKPSDSSESPPIAPPKPPKPVIPGHESSQDLEHLGLKDALIARTAQKTGKSLSAVTLGFGLLGKALDNFRLGGLQVLDDAFRTLAARGYGTTKSLSTLYSGAINAGMSLQDYARFMDENMISISRASSFADFQKNLNIGTDGLAKFGVFGQDATKLAGTMMSASTALGVPQAQMGEALKAQTEVFGKLRDKSNITADEFKALTEIISKDADVRTELSALDSSERLARQTQLTEQISYARSLNLSTEEVQKYTSAILAQRKSTVKQRFQQAGRLTQAAGMLGMGGDVDALRKLALNRYKTPEEEKQFNDLLAQMNTGLEQMQQSGSPGSQFQADTIREALDGTGLAERMASAAAIAAGKQSGPTKNKDLNVPLTSIDITIGKVSTLLEGWGKNPVATFVTSLVGGIGSIIAALPAHAALMGWIAGKQMAAASGGGLGGGLPDGGKGGKGKWAGRLGKGIPFLGAGIGLYEGVTGYMGAEDKAKATDGDVGKAKGEAIGEGLGSALGGGLAALAIGLAPFTGGISLLVGGIAALAGAFGGGMLGKWIGGMIGSESAAEKSAKENAKELKKNTDAIKDEAKARLATAGSSVIASDNLGSLTANIIKSTNAMRAPTAEEQKKILDKGKTPEEIAAAISKPTQPGSIALAGSIPDAQRDAYLRAANAVGGGYGGFMTSPASIATPGAGLQGQTIVNPADVNKTVLEAQKAEKAEKLTPSILTPSVQDPAAILAQILAVLKDSLTAENLQVDMTSQLARSLAGAKFTDNEVLNRRVIDQR